MREILEVLPGALLPDPVAESAAPGAPLSPPDDDDLLRPSLEEQLFRVGDRGALTGGSTTALAKHLVGTFGPIHRALPFPMQLRVELDGDRLATVDPETGFLHQGLEKAAECTPWQDTFELVARLHPLSPVTHELCWALALERLWGIADAVPEQAQLWRVVALELARLAEHLRVLSTPPLPPATGHALRALVEAARRTRGLSDALVTGRPFPCVGGLARPIHDDEAVRIEKELPHIAGLLNDVMDNVRQSPALDAHLEGLGRISAPRALSAGLTGPALRACGVADDLRIHEPVFAYSAVSVTAQIPDASLAGGCTRARGRVRLLECVESIALVHDALARLRTAPEGIRAPGDHNEREAPVGLATASLEAANGEISFLVVSDGGTCPAHVRMRGPSSALIGALPAMLVGGRIDDVTAVIASLGLIGTEADR